LNGEVLFECNPDFHDPKDIITQWDLVKTQPQHLYNRVIALYKVTEGEIIIDEDRPGTSRESKRLISIEKAGGKLEARELIWANWASDFSISLSGQKWITILGHILFIDHKNHPKGVVVKHPELSNFYQINISSSGKYLAFTKRRLLFFSSNEVLLWNLQENRVMSKSFHHNATVKSMAFSYNDALFATASGKSIYLWNPETGKRIDELIGHKQPVEQLVFSPNPNNHILVSVSTDGYICLWDYSSIA
jgi:WD40 repeat protein